MLPATVCLRSIRSLAWRQPQALHTSSLLLSRDKQLLEDDERLLAERSGGEGNEQNKRAATVEEPPGFVDEALSTGISGLSHLIQGTVRVASGSIELAESSGKGMLRAVGGATRGALDFVGLPHVQVPLPQPIKAAVGVATSGVRAGKELVTSVGALIEEAGALGGSIVGASARVILDSKGSEGSTPRVFMPRTTRAASQLGSTVVDGVTGVLTAATTSSTRLVEAASEEAIELVDRVIGHEVAKTAQSLLESAKDVTDTIAETHNLTSHKLLHKLAHSARKEAIRSTSEALREHRKKQDKNDDDF